MLKPSTPPHALEIPEIVLKVVWHLNAAEVLACSSVSRSFYSSFAPHVWQDLHFGQPTLDLDLEPLARILSSNGAPGHFGRPDFLKIAPWLRSIIIGGLSPSDEAHTNKHWDNCKKIFRQNRSSLQSVSLINWKYDPHNKPVPGRPLWNPILKCAQAWNLRSLSLERCMIRGKHSNLFWTICERLERLRLDDVQFDLSKSPLGRETNKRVTAPGDSAPEITVELDLTRMRDLRLRGIHSVPVLRQLNQLIRRCPNLQTLYWNTDSYHYDIQSAFCDLYAASTWPDLDWIVVLTFLKDEDLVKLLQAAKKPFRRLDFGYSKMQPETFELFRQSHFSTIQRINLLNFKRLKRNWVVQVLASCPSLECFRADEIGTREILESEPWVCKRLRVFRVFIYVDISDSGYNRKFTREELQQFRAVYRRLAFLKELKELDMLPTYTRAMMAAQAEGHTLVPLPLCLKAGLGQLSELTKLEKISFWSGKQATFKEELVWMVDCWKRLKNFTGAWYVRPNATMDSQDRFATSDKLKMWMREQRIDISSCRYIPYIIESPDDTPCDDMCGPSDGDDD
ncbi:hypothetical protein BGX26_006834 [Mortierella sp. AD094]|nr:hypothetical protein BGX26_006834 [Mortierella sp. AD094]